MLKDRDQLWVAYLLILATLVSMIGDVLLDYHHQNIEDTFDLIKYYEK